MKRSGLERELENSDFVISYEDDVAAQRAE